MTRLKQWLYPWVESLDLSLFLPRLYNCRLCICSLVGLCQEPWCYILSWLDHETHVSNLVRSANFELRRNSSIRHLLSTDATKTLVSAFVLSRLDYCNSLLFGCPQYLLNKLQKVQNNAARLVPRVSKTDHIFPHLASLHWLPMDSRIQYKLSSLCYNCLNSTAPDYLTELLRIYKPTRQLRSSSDTAILCIPSVRTHLLGQRSFSYAAPAVWNTLPYEIRSSNTISSFKSSLKTSSFFSSPTDCVCVCVRERERGGEGEREN